MIDPTPRPKAVMDSQTAMVMSACGKLYVTVDRTPDGHIKGLTVPSVKSGGCLAASLDAVCGVARLAIRKGATLAEVADQLEGLSCHKRNGDIQTCYQAIAQGIRMELEARM